MQSPTARTIRLLLAAVLTLAALFALHPDEHHTNADAGQAAAVIDLVNQYRAERDLNTLTTHPSLMAAAQSHVDWMVATGSYGHTGEGGSTPADRAKAAGYPTAGWYVYENWVGGGAMSPAEAVAWWDSSPIHKQTMTLQGFDHIGVGHANSGRGNIYVLLIAQPSYQPTPVPGAEAGAPAGPPTPTPYYVEPIVQAEPDAEGTITHVVGEGQTAWDIAVVYGVDLNEMLDINRLQRPVLLKPGDSIIVKLGPNATPPPREPQMHTVGPGESAWTIAAIYGITLDELLIANALERPAILHEGDVLTIPAPMTATPTPTPTP